MPSSTTQIRSGMAINMTRKLPMLIQFLFQFGLVENVRLLSLEREIISDKYDLCLSIHHGT